MSLFNTTDTDRIKEWTPPPEDRVALTLSLPEASEENTLFEQAAHELQHLAPALAITRQAAEKGLPGFDLAPNIRFSALPAQKELPPFLEALSREKENLPETVRSALDSLDIPVHLTLYIALACPHCPGMVRTVIPLARRSPKIRLDIIDGSLFDARARQDHVLSAPCLILDSDFRWTGAVSPEEITAMITDRDPAALGVESLKNIMEEGNADWITRQMIQQKKIFPAVADLLGHPTWSVRLGAMVIVEALAEEAPEIAQTLCPLLIKDFDDKDIPAQGDLLYALAEAGTPDTAQWIRDRLAGFTHPDLKEAAMEALDTLDEKE